MKKWPLIASMMVIMVASIFAGAGTMAWFSDTETSSENTFTAGTIDITLYGSDGQAVWTMDNMKPGDKATGILYIKNTGSLDIKYLLGKMVYTETDAGGDLYWARLDDYFYVKAFRLGKGTTRAEAYATLVDFWATLGSRIPSTSGQTPDDFTGEHIGSYCTHYVGDWTDEILGSYAWFARGEPLKSGEVLALEYAFEFTDNGLDQNNAQGDSLTIEFTVEAISTTQPLSEIRPKA